MNTALRFVFLWTVAAALPAQADTLTFHGVAAASCALSAPADGVISLQADLQSWLTTQPAQITATNTAPATVTVTRPTSWSSSPSGTPSTSFSHTANLTGTNVGTLTGSGTASSGALTALGSTTVYVTLGAVATRAFQAGTYDAQVTVTCTVP